MLHPVEEKVTKCEMYLKRVFEIIYCSATYAFFALVIEYYLSNNERVGHRKSFDLQLIGIRKPGY